MLSELRGPRRSAPLYRTAAGTGAPPAPDPACAPPRPSGCHRQQARARSLITCCSIPQVHVPWRCVRQHGLALLAHMLQHSARACLRCMHLRAPCPHAAAHRKCMFHGDVCDSVVCCGSWLHTVCISATCDSADTLDNVMCDELALVQVRVCINGLRHIICRIPRSWCASGQSCECSARRSRW